MSTKLKVGWHREHFLSPLLQLAAKDSGETFELVECPGGTGEMQVKLREGEIDVCIDALIAGLANGQTAYRLVGRYISNPLRWYALINMNPFITGKDSKYNSISDLKGSTFGISRLGSGSQVMASVLGMNEAWSGDEAPKFKGAYSFCAWAIRPQDIGPVAIRHCLQGVNGQFKPLRDSVNSGETSAFLWEWFTTKPYVDSGEVRFIGSVYTPWPCWSIAATPSTSTDQLKTFLSSLEPYVRHFNSPEAREKEDIDFVVNYFGHRREDVEEWLKTVKWEEELSVVEDKVVQDTLSILEKAGVVKAKEGGWDSKDFVHTDVARLA